MRVVKLEFTYFDSAEWSNKGIDITALTMISLMKVFIQETRWIHKPYHKGTVSMWRKELWNKVKSDIEYETLDFPIVIRKGW